MMNVDHFSPFLANTTTLTTAANSRKEVDQMVNKAIAAGGKEPRAAQDHGWMYGRSFQDLDGHIWEIFYMDEKSMPQKMKNKK